MARIILGVTGSVAAVQTPLLHDTLLDQRHNVRVVATEPALHFFDASQLVASAGEPRGPLYRDIDEWGDAPYRRGDPVLHIEFRKWADLLVIAPLDANTLAKLALGISDNFLTCLFRAWDWTKPVVIAPAMNTLMWQNPTTVRHLRQLLTDFATSSDLPDSFSLDQAPELFAAHASRIILIPPMAKQLACGDLGVGAMAEVPAIAEIVRRWAEPTSLG